MTDNTEPAEAGGDVPVTDNAPASPAAPPNTEAGGDRPATADVPASPAAPPKSKPPAVLAAIGRGWLAFRRWRRSRPYWAGILLVISGAELLLIPLPIHSMGVILHIGIGGVLGILIGAILIVLGLLLWFHPAQRAFYSIVAVLLAIAALVASNLGGFLLGTLLGVIGGSLGFAWMPGRPERRYRGRRARTRGDAPDAGIEIVADAEPAEDGDATAADEGTEPDTAEADIDSGDPAVVAPGAA